MFLRYMRLLPLHAFMVGLLLALELVFLGLTSMQDLAGREPFGARREWWTLPATLLLLQEYVHAGERPWNSSSWSISVEVGLYFMAALLWRYCGRWGTWLALTIALAAMVLLDLPQGRASADILRGLAGFGLGMALYELWLRVRHIEIPAVAASGAEMALVAAMVLTITYLPLFGLPARGTTDLVFAALILMFAFERGIVSRMLLTRPFVWLGTLSYSIYMVHGFVHGRTYDLLTVLQSLTGWHLVRVRPGMTLLDLPPWQGALVTAAMLTGSVIMAWCTWRWIEEPARLWSKRKAAEWGAAGAEARAAWR